jgi:hypothetical protein
MMDPDDDDYSLFDEEDTDTSADPSQAWASSLIVGEPLASADDLTRLEAQYRRDGVAPMLFTFDDEATGLETLDPDCEERFARAMGRPGTPVSYEEALAWIAENTDPTTGRWMGG